MILMSTVIQPSSGYVYNANHSPFLSTDEQNNPKNMFADEMNFETYDNNRSKRLKNPIDSLIKFPLMILNNKI